MYESLCVDVKVERGFSFLSSRTTFHTFMSISFTHAKIARHWKSTLSQTLYQLKLTTREGSLFTVIYKDRIQERENQVNHLTRCAT